MGYNGIQWDTIEGSTQPQVHHFFLRCPGASACPGATRQRARDLLCRETPISAGPVFGEQTNKWRMADDTWRMADDKCRIADDTWRMADDKCRIADDKCRIADGGITNAATERASRVSFGGRNWVPFPLSCSSTGRGALNWSTALLLSRSVAPAGSTEKEFQESAKKKVFYGAF